MFTVEERGEIRRTLLDFAVSDSRISGTAITGSAAADREDRWSDIDLAFGVRTAGEMTQVLSDWTERMYSRYAAVHHVDVLAGAWIYRVFLFSSTLQVDLAFVPATEFRALSSTFHLVSGEANPPSPAALPEAGNLIGMAWLYALHARSSIARGRLWQAQYMVSGVRDHAMSLACLRHGLSTVHGRGFDGLPSLLCREFESSLVRRLEAGEISRALEAACGLLLHEIRAADPSLAQRVEDAIREIGRAETA